MTTASARRRGAVEASVGSGAGAGVLAAAVLAAAASCAEQPPVVGGGCFYQPYDTTCEPIAGEIDASGMVWVRFRAALDGPPEVRTLVEIEAPPPQRDAALAALKRPLRCRGERIMRGSCAPYEAPRLELPELPEGARIVFSGHEAR